MEDGLLSRQMPHSMNAEQAVLGSMLIDPENCIQIVAKALKSNDFYMNQNREICEAIYHMNNFGETIDPVTILNKVCQASNRDEQSVRNYMQQLMEVTPTASNVTDYIKIVKNHALERSILNAANDLSSIVYEGTNDPDNIIDLAAQRFSDIRDGRQARGLVSLQSVMQEVLEQLETLATAGGTLPGLSTGMKDVDSAISGLNDSDLLLIAARPGMGKTSFALNVLLEVGKRSGKTAVFFSLEMGAAQLAKRLLSSEISMDNKKLVTGKLTDHEWQNIAIGSMALSHANILIDDNSGLSVADMKSKCMSVPDLGVVIIDYLQLMQSAGGKSRGGGENRQQVVSDISRALKLMARDLNVPVICLSQLSRGPESRQDKRPMLSDLRDSGAIEQDADIVMFLYRDDYYNEDSEDHNIAECIIAKNRHGETGKVRLQWMPEFTTFTDYDHAHYDEEY